MKKFLIEYFTDIEGEEYWIGEYIIETISDMLRDDCRVSEFDIEEDDDGIVLTMGNKAWLQHKLTNEKTFVELIEYIEAMTARCDGGVHREIHFGIHIHWETLK